MWECLPVSRKCQTSSVVSARPSELPVTSSQPEKPKSLQQPQSSTEHAANCCIRPVSQATHNYQGHLGRFKVYFEAVRRSWINALWPKNKILLGVTIELLRHWLATLIMSETEEIELICAILQNRNLKPEAAISALR